MLLLKYIINRSKGATQLLPRIIFPTHLDELNGVAVEGTQGYAAAQHRNLPLRVVVVEYRDESCALQSYVTCTDNTGLAYQYIRTHTHTKQAKK